ncbi:MAG: ArsR/SmtB family transcription factor [Culicoidibacterales bacterium]
MNDIRKSIGSDCSARDIEKVEQIINIMPLKKDVDNLAELFSALGDPTRLRILRALMEAEICVCDIAVILDMTKSAISHQLRILKSVRLVEGTKQGRNVMYRLADDHVRTILAQGITHIAEVI